MAVGDDRSNYGREGGPRSDWPSGDVRFSVPPPSSRERGPEEDMEAPARESERDRGVEMMEQFERERELADENTLESTEDGFEEGELWEREFDLARQAEGMETEDDGELEAIEGYEAASDEAERWPASDNERQEDDQEDDPLEDTDDPSELTYGVGCEAGDVEVDEPEKLVGALDTGFSFSDAIDWGEGREPSLNEGLAPLDRSPELDADVLPTFGVAPGWGSGVELEDSTDPGFGLGRVGFAGSALGDGGLGLTGGLAGASALGPVGDDLRDPLLDDSEFGGLGSLGSLGPL